MGNPGPCGTYPDDIGQARTRSEAGGDEPGVSEGLMMGW